MRALFNAARAPAARGAVWLARAFLGAAWGAAAFAQTVPQPPARSAVSDIPAAGFSTFGEILGIPINQTLSALVFFRSGNGYQDNFMDAFPVHYADFASHYSQRALQRWITLGRPGGRRLRSQEFARHL